jgi:hypothetical protein
VRRLSSKQVNARLARCPTLRLGVSEKIIEGYETRDGVQFLSRAGDGRYAVHTMRALP